jgi:hypothetical protein
MTWLEIVIKVVCILFGIATACIIVLPKLKKAIAARKAAKTEEEKAKANAEIKDYVLEFIGVAEDKHAALNTALKNIGETGAGQFKKDAVLTQTRDYCDEKGYDFNKQEISDYIDKVIDLTKKVN